MKKGIYAIYDKKAEAIQTNVLMVFATIAVAIRTFSDIVQNNENIKAHPEDYALIHLGDLNEAEDEIVSNNNGREIKMEATSIMALNAENTTPELVKEA